MPTLWILRLACLMQLASMGVLFAFDAVRMKDMGIGETAIGAILAVSSGVFIGSSIFWGRIADRRQAHRTIVIWGSVGIGLLLTGFSLSRTPAHFLLYGVLKGVFMPMISGMMSALAVQAVGRERTGKGIGTYRAFGSMGFILGTMGLPMIFDDIGRAAQAAAVIILASVLLLRHLPVPEKTPAEAADRPSRRRHPGILLFLGAYFFIALGEPSVHAFFTAYARELGAGTRLLGMLSGSMGLVAMISLPLMGRVIDRVHPAFVLAGAFFAQPVRIFLISLIDDPHLLWIPILLHGICWGGIEVCAIVYLSSLAGARQRATVLSDYMAMRMTGMLVGAALSGWLADHYGYPLMFRTIAAATLLGAAGWLTGVLALRVDRQAAA